jgi:ribosomal-protein-alanine N-acetyltransferase
MTPDALAAIHKSAFSETGRGWSADELADYLTETHTHLITSPQGFALLRVIADQAELLTIAVHPDAQSRGEGRKLMDDVLKTARQHNADALFLEVAQDNQAARALYNSCGFDRAAFRKNYYKRAGRDAVSALVLRKTLR